MQGVFLVDGEYVAHLAHFVGKHGDATFLCHSFYFGIVILIWIGFEVTIESYFHLFYIKFQAKSVKGCDWQ